MNDFIQHAIGYPSICRIIALFSLIFEQVMNYSLSIQSGYTAYASAGILWITPKKPMKRGSECG